MPWRLFGLIVIVGILLVFVGFNLNNTCAISFGFVSFTDVPVFLTIFVSFILGMLCSLPFIIFKTLRKKFRPEKPGKFRNQEEAPANNSGGESCGID
jgi:uncharacterized integral membrane protein